MNATRITAAVVAALVAGAVMGKVTSGFAATAPAPAPAQSAPAGLGLRLGTAMRDAGARLVDVVAKLTGLDADDVLAKRQAGTSYEQIAKDAGVSTDKVIDQSLAVRKGILDDKVKAGTITADQADAALDRMETRLNDRISATDDSCTGAGGQGGGMGRGRGGAGGGGRGMGAGACVAQ